MRVVRIAQVGYSVPILVAIFACAIPQFPASTALIDVGG